MPGQTDQAPGKTTGSGKGGYPSHRLPDLR